MLKAMRFDTVFGPHPHNTHVRDIAQFQRQLATAPMSGAIGWLSLGRPFKNARLPSFALLTWRSAGMARVQSGQTLGNKAALSASDQVGVAVQFVANQPVALAISEQQNNRARRACAASRD
jgi:hypothetical protein